MDGLKLSTDKLDLAAPDRCDLTLSDFHELSRAAGPKGQMRWKDSARFQCVLGESYRLNTQSQASASCPK